MIENLKNKSYPKKIESELYIDDIKFNKEKLSKTLCIKHNNNINDNIIKSNILLNSLQDFINRCEATYGKIFYEKKYIISFNEILSLIKQSIIAQQQLDKNVYYNIEKDSHFNISNIKNINEKFINDLNYNILSLEKIDKKNERKNSINFKSQNSHKNSKKMLITPRNMKNRSNSIFNNIYKEVFINDDETLDNYITKKSSASKTTTNSSRKNIKTLNKRNKNIFLKKNIKNRTIANGSTINKENKENNSININRELINRNYYILNSLSNDSININFYKKNELNNNSSKPKKSLKNNIKENFDIYKACKNMKKGKKINNENKGNKAAILISKSGFFSIDSNNNEESKNNSILKMNLKNLGFNKINANNMRSGIRKIIISNACKPTRFTNHLLISGKKYINDFKEMDKDNKKKEF